MKKERLFLLSFFFLISATFAQNQANETFIQQHLVNITKTEGFRNHENVVLLNQIADYIYKEFEKYADTVYRQRYEVDGKMYQNVICAFSASEKKVKTIVVGAHYDVCGNQEGADDNASGLVGLLELARMLKGAKLAHRVELVAYTLEEPPYFRTEYMGSYVHAKSLKDNHIDVYGMVSLEMIGYFRPEKNTQSYPLGFLKYAYGNKGDFITLVRKFGAGRFARKFITHFRHTHSIKSKKFIAPASLTGIDFSDHLNYWNMGFSALMLTDTSFYRNPNYHEEGDKMETLDIPKIAQVIEGVWVVLSNL